MNGFVLVVDDDQAIRETLCELLEDEGHRVVGAANGKEALEILRGEGHACLILLDVMMPVMDGPTFRAAQMNDPNLSRIPVAVITAAGRDTAPTLDAQAVLRKPLRLEDVLRIIERFCPVPPRA